MPDEPGNRCLIKLEPGVCKVMYMIPNTPDKSAIVYLMSQVDRTEALEVGQRHLREDRVVGGRTEASEEGQKRLRKDRGV